MTLEEAIKRYTSNAFYEKSDGNLQGYLEFNQLAEWLKDYKRLLEQEPTQMIDKSNFSQEQYKTDLQSAYDCGKSVLDKIRAEIERKANSGQWSEATIYGMKKSIAIIDKYREVTE